VVDGAENKDLAWYYPSPSAKARRIDGRIAFWRNVEVADDTNRPSVRSRLFGRP